MIGRGGRALLAVLLGMTTLGPGSISAALARPLADREVIPAAVSPTVDLGQFAVNGTVRAAVVDRTTGNTYLGGNFTKVGRRTGSVAIVDPPNVSDGTAHPGPEVLGTVVAVFADERPSDPGFFIIGRLTAINGLAVPQRLAYRVHLAGGAWALDPGWTAAGDCHTGNVQFPVGSRWIATPTLLIGGGAAGPGSQVDSPTGLTVIDRATGQIKAVGGGGCAASQTLLPAIPMLPGISTCGGQSNCYAVVDNLSYDPTAKRVLVDYLYVGGSTGPVPPATWEGLAAYDLTPGTGGRKWLRALAAGSPADPGRNPYVSSLGSLPGAFLVRGQFQLDATVGDALDSRLLLVDAATGAIRQRWNSLGEQNLADGTTSGPGTLCETGSNAIDQREMGRFGTDAYGWLNPSGLCRYRLVGAGLDTGLIVGVGLAYTQGRRMPSTPFTSPGGGDYLLGSDAAVDLSTGAMTTWDPAPGVNPNADLLSVAVVAGSVIIAGEFSFVRGVASPGIAAFDAGMVPLQTFVSPLDRTATAVPGVNALALTDGRLIAGGDSLGIPGFSSLVAVDSATGQPDPWHPSSTLPVAIDTIAVAPAGDIWIGGITYSPAANVPLQHYAALAAGGMLLPSPTVDCLLAPDVNGPSTPTCARGWAGLPRVQSLLIDESGRLYLAGVFGSVAGSPRQGLARIEKDGSLAAWDPNLVGTLPIPANGSLDTLEPHSLALIGDRLVVGGSFRYAVPNPGGGSFGTAVSPLLVFSTTSGALVRPTDPQRSAWFDLAGWWPVGYAMAHTAGGLLVALGQPGMGIFDATTLDLDVSASAPYLDTNWMSPVKDGGIYTLAVPFGSEPVVATVGTAATMNSTSAAAPAGRLVVGGVIPRWGNRVAGNVFQTTIGADVSRPTATAPRVVPAIGQTMAPGTVPARVTWVGADPHGSGVARYELAMSVSGGAYRSLGTYPTPAANVTLTTVRAYRFRVRATDFAGNIGIWTYGPTVTDAVIQQTRTSIRYSSGWRTVASANFLGGSVKQRGVVGATASYRFTGRSVGFVTTFGPARGRVKVYVDGRYVRTIDLWAKTYRYQVVAWSTSWPTLATHTVKLVLAGPSTRARVDLDAFAVIR